MSNKGRKRTFNVFFVSYILIAIIPVVSLGAIFYYYNVVNYRKDISESNLNKLVQVKSQVDSELKLLKDITYHISNNTQIIDVDIEQDEYNKANIVSQLKAYMDNCIFLDDIWFYYRGDENIFSTQEYQYYHQFEVNTKRGIEWWKSNFFKNLNSTISPKISRLDIEETNQGANNRLLAFMYPIPYLNTLPSATVVYIMREESILSKFENFFGEFKEHVFIFDNQYNLLVSDGNNTSNTDRKILEEECKNYRNTGVLDIGIGDNKYIGMRVVSEETGWSYIVVMPPKQFFHRIKTRQITILGIIFTIILSGSILALALSRKSYKPIKALSLYIKNQDNQQNYYEGKSDLEMIRFNFQRSYEKNRELIVQVDAQRPFVRDQCLTEILRGKVKDKDKLDYLLKCANLELHGAAYFTIVASTKIRNLNIVDVEDLLKVLEDIYFVGARGYGVELIQESLIAITVSIGEEIHDFKIVQTAIAEDVSQLVENEFDLIPAIGVGNIYQDILQLNTSFLEALSALYENYTNSSANVFYFSDMKKAQKQLGGYPVVEQSLYIESLKQGDTTVAVETLNSIIDAITEETTSYFMVKLICFDVLNNVMKSINKIHPYNFTMDIEKLATFNTLDEFKEIMEKLTNEYCNYVDDLKNNKRNELKRNIIKYVNDNYMSIQISLDDIARKFDISSTYVSRFFKDETGVNFIDYITNKRMDYAKKQLRSTNKLIKDIATEIGYIDASSFSRKFREVEGVTPGQYRKMTEQVSYTRDA